MTTAFQPDAFQSDAFQIDGGVTAGATTIAINATLEGDSGLVTLQAARQGGAAGRAYRYVAFINGKRYVGTLPEIEELVEEFAEEQAKQAIAKAKAPKKPRIVVEAGKDVPKRGMAPAQAESVLPIQAQIRDHYLRAYIQAMQELEQDEEDAILALL